MARERTTSTLRRYGFGAALAVGPHDCPHDHGGSKGTNSANPSGYVRG